MASAMSIKGGEELRRALLALGATGAKRAMRKAEKKAVRPIYSEAKSVAPVGKTKAYKKGIKIRSRTRGNTVSTTVSATAPTAAILEKGTVDRYRKGGGRGTRKLRARYGYTGKGPAMHIMHDVADRTGQGALDSALEVLQTEIVAEAKKSGGA